MNRRTFIKTTLASLLIPCGIARTEALCNNPGSIPPDYIFYDDRFNEARQFAEQMAFDSVITPVKGDMTGIWKAGLANECTHRPVMMQGITTESFYFCLQGMIRSVAKTHTNITRINRYLFLWDIQSNNYSV